MILVGDDPASRSYVTSKQKACAAAGIQSREIALPATASQAEILAAVRQLNEDEATDGVLVQLPLPDSTMEADVLAAVDPAKDVDGFHALNIGRLVQGSRRWRLARLVVFWSCCAASGFRWPARMWW